MPVGFPPTGFEPDTGTIPNQSGHYNNDIVKKQMDAFDIIVLAKYTGRNERNLGSSRPVKSTHDYFFQDVRVLKGEPFSGSFNARVHLAKAYTSRHEKAPALEEGKTYLIFAIKRQRHTDSKPIAGLYSAEHWYEVPQESFIIPIR